jgi:hypothetical protein
MSYKHEIFISYKWGSTKEWVDKIFKPILEEVMESELPFHPLTFKDTSNIVHGAALDLSLQDALAHSKCMVSIVSLEYFAKSIWCPMEFSAMLYREEKTGVKKNGNHTGFVFPVIIINSKKKELEKQSSLFEYKELRELLLNFTPLRIDREYSRTDEAFINEGKRFRLKTIVTDWFNESIKPLLLKEYPWQKEWATEEYLTKPYEVFKTKYNIFINPMTPPSIR